MLWWIGWWRGSWWNRWLPRDLPWFLPIILPAIIGLLFRWPLWRHRRLLSFVCHCLTQRILLQNSPALPVCKAYHNHNVLATRLAANCSSFPPKEVLSVEAGVMVAAELGSLLHPPAFPTKIMSRLSPVRLFPLPGNQWCSKIFRAGMSAVHRTGSRGHLMLLRVRWPAVASRV